MSEPVLTDVCGGKLHFSDGSTLDLPDGCRVRPLTDGTAAAWDVDAGPRAGQIGRGRKRCDCEGFVAYVWGR